MSGLQITIGAAAGLPLWQSLVTALSPAVVAGLAALGGVALTNHAFGKHRRADERRLAREQDAADAVRADQEIRDRGLAALAMAEHLEDYVLACADVVSSFWNVEWVTPYDWESPSGDAPGAVSVLPEWPELVDWKLLGLETAVRASNFRRRTQLVRGGLTAGSAHMTPDDQLCDEADEAAVLALDAWALAEETREKHGLAPFDTHGTWDFIASVREHQAKRERIKATNAASDGLLGPTADAATEET